MSLLMVSMDNTITNVALQAIRLDLHASVVGLQWIVDGYTVVLSCLLVFCGSIADRVGRRRVLGVGLSLFALSSLLCSLTPGVSWLVVFRMLQAVGGSMLNPVAMSIVVTVFADRRERSLAIGVWGSVYGLGFALGPLVGGMIIAATSWRGVFWINVPIAILRLP